MRVVTRSRYSVTRKRMRDSVVTMFACIVHIGERTGGVVEEGGGGEGRKRVMRSTVFTVVGSMGRAGGWLPASTPPRTGTELLSAVTARGECAADDSFELRASAFGRPSRVKVSAGQGQADVPLR